MKRVPNNSYMALVRIRECGRIAQKRNSDLTLLDPMECHNELGVRIKWRVISLFPTEGGRESQGVEGKIMKWPRGGSVVNHAARR